VLEVVVVGSCCLMYVLQYVGLVKQHSPYSIVDVSQVYLIAKFIILVVKKVAGIP